MEALDISKPLPSSELLYFPPKEFSPRYGSRFFTADITGFSIEGHKSACGGEYAVFAIDVSRGHKKWSILKRFREFDALHKSNIEYLVDFRDKIPALPPKTCSIIYSNLNEGFLSERRNLLTTYLNDILHFLSTEKLMASESGLIVQHFLNLDKHP